MVKWYGTNTDIDDRRRVEEARRAAEQLARGQLEALQQALVLLSRESGPEKFLDHVLCIICEQLGADGISAWEMKEQVGS